MNNFWFILSFRAFYELSNFTISLIFTTSVILGNSAIFTNSVISNNFRRVGEMFDDDESTSVISDESLSDDSGEFNADIEYEPTFLEWLMEHEENCWWCLQVGGNYDVISAQIGDGACENHQITEANWRSDKRLRITHGRLMKLPEYGAD